MPLPDEIEDSVPQIENYDRWLTSQTVPHKGGIVLAIPNLLTEVDELNTTNQWCCLRWSDLAAWVESALEYDSLPNAEQTLAEHFLGFVWNNLRDPSDMSKDQLGIDDLALTRAFESHGRECEARIKNLTQPLVEALKQSGIDFVSGPKFLSSSFWPTTRSTAFGQILDDNLFDSAVWMNLHAGVLGQNAVLFIESTKRNSIKKTVKRICQQRSDALQQRNTNWFVEKSDEFDAIDVILKKPLTWLLNEDDQSKALQEFVQAGLEDLKATGLIDTLQAIPGEVESQ
ncbi:MAG: hypothetical protein HUJ26_20320 [Planctomycetaceae bacterium]|nr:hypothetical protein [Planctomycetaceae bacterium]